MSLQGSKSLLTSRLPVEALPASASNVGSNVSKIICPSCSLHLSLRIHVSKEESLPVTKAQPLARMEAQRILSPPHDHGKALV